MNPILNQQLAQIKVQEMLQEAAEARADRKARKAHPNPVARKLKIAFAVAIPLVLPVVWVFMAG